MKKISILGLTVGVILMSACSDCPEVETLNIADVKAERVSLEKAYSDASTGNDIEALLSYYADDAKSMAPNEVTRVGMSEIREATVKEMAGDIGNVSVMEVQNVWAAGEIAVESGTYTVTSLDGEVVSIGKYMSLFEKRNGKYVCIRDIWNSDLELEEDEDDLSEMESKEL